MSADEMFEKLGYEKENRDYAEVYFQRTKYAVKQIGFSKQCISVQVGGIETITMFELAAINKKVEELRLEQRGEIEYE